MWTCRMSEDPCGHPLPRPSAKPSATPTSGKVADRILTGEQSGRLLDHLLVIHLHHPPRAICFAQLLLLAGFYISFVLKFKVEIPAPHTNFFSIVCVNWISIGKLHLEGSHNRSMIFISQWRHRVDKCDFSSHYFHFLGLNGISETWKPIIISKHNQKYQHVRKLSKLEETKTFITMLLWYFHHRIECCGRHHLAIASIPWQRVEDVGHIA